MNMSATTTIQRPRAFRPFEESTMKYFYMIRNNGDGSSSVEFVDSEETQKLLAKQDPEAYQDGDGDTSGFLEITSDHIDAENENMIEVTHNGHAISPTTLAEAQKLTT